MKKLSISVLALGLFFTTSAFNPLPGDDTSSRGFFNVSNAKSVKADKVATAATKAFDAKFATAQGVTWKEASGVFFVDFKVSNKALQAAYSDKGEMIAMSRFISVDALPLAVTETLNERFSGYVLPINVTEIVMDGSTSYYMVVQGKTKNLQLKCTSDGNIAIEKKFKKKVLVGRVM